MMDNASAAAVTLRAELRTPSSSGRRTRCSIDPAGTDRLPTSDRQTSVRSSCPSTTTLDRPWPPSATPFDEDEPNEVDGGSLDGPEVFPEVVDQPATTSWDWFDEHIRCITTADPREQFVKKRSTDKASDTYKATMQEICGSLERLEIPADSDEEIPLSAIGDTARDLEVLSRQTSVVETSRAKTHRKVKDIREQPEVSEMRTAASTARWKTESASAGMHRNQHHRPHQQHQHQQQQHLDENAMKRMMLYEKYLERQNAWAEGLTKSGKEILMAIQRRKKRSSRFPTSCSSSTDDFRRPRMVRSTTWCSSSNTSSAFRAFAPAAAAESSLSCNG